MIVVSAPGVYAVNCVIAGKHLHPAFLALALRTGLDGHGRTQWLPGLHPAGASSALPPPVATTQSVPRDTKLPCLGTAGLPGAGSGQVLWVTVMFPLPCCPPGFVTHQTSCRVQAASSVLLPGLLSRWPHGRETGAAQLASPSPATVRDRRGSKGRQLGSGTPPSGSYLLLQGRWRRPSRPFPAEKTGQSSWPL